MKNTQKYKIEDYAGMEFSKLTVIGEVYIPRNLPRKKYVRKFECKMCLRKYLPSFSK